MQQKMKMIFLILLFMSMSARTWAAAGDLDVSFGNNGKVRIGPFYGSEGLELLTQPDGKIIVAAVTYATPPHLYLGPALTLFHLLPDGSLDPAIVDPLINGEGLLYEAFAFYADDVDISFGQEGKIVMVGSDNYEIEPGVLLINLMRVHGDTSLDQTFIDGDPLVDPGHVEETSVWATTNMTIAGAVQADGKIVVGTSGFLNEIVTNYYHFALLRYNVDGSLDSSFGDQGHVFTSFGNTNAHVEDMVVQADGKIVVIGCVSTTVSCASTSSFAMARYETDGSLDLSFGTNGLVTTEVEPGFINQAKVVKLQTDGKILIGGEANEHAALVRYNTDGSLDTAFGANGIANVFVDKAAIHTLSLQSNGKIVAGGVVDEDFLLIRYNPDGSADESFGALGVVQTDINNGAFDRARGSGIQSDGKILLTGLSWGSLTEHTTIVRYEGGDCVVGANYDDHDACTIDACDPSGIVTHTPVIVDDPDDCILDRCDSATGIITHFNLRAGAACDDGDICTSDACNNFGTCVGTALDVDDHNPCTADDCDADFGVTHISVPDYPITRCNDGNICTIDDICQKIRGFGASVCVGTLDPDCMKVPD